MAESNLSPDVTLLTSEALESTVKDYFSLLKPRVMSLVVFSGFVGLYLAPGSINPFIAFIAILCIAIGSGAAGAINMWYERDIDLLMERTRHRPLPAKRIAASDALHFAVTLATGSVLMMGLLVNLLAAALLSIAILFYVFIYTIWLKRLTPQNIVIGGAAGAFPPMIGYAAVTGSISLPAIILFAIIFFWTPPHFWALSLYRADDYAKAGIPMLPVVAGTAHTKQQILIYSMVLFAVSLLPCYIGMAGFIYLIAAILLGGKFIYHAVMVYQTGAASNSAPLMFKYSIIYLFLLLSALLLDKIFA
jgi:protoheme IX farnesyltransferase